MEVELPLVGTRGLEGTLVAPRTTKPVPNHLSDTSKFTVEYKSILLEIYEQSALANYHYSCRDLC